MPPSDVCIPTAGSARATSSPPATSAESSGRASTRSSTRDHRPVLETLVLMRPTKGTRPFSTRSPSFDSSAGSTVSEPITATATTMIVPVANEAKLAIPPRYMPAIATITVRPEIRTERPEVAAAASIAASLSRPAARSSRSRLR